MPVHVLSKLIVCTPPLSFSKAVFQLAVVCLQCCFSCFLGNVKEVQFELWRLLISMTMSKKSVEFYSCRLLTLLTIEKLTYFFSLHLGYCILKKTCQCTEYAFQLFQQFSQVCRIGFSLVCSIVELLILEWLLRIIIIHCPQSTSCSSHKDYWHLEKVRSTLFDGSITLLRYCKNASIKHLRQNLRIQAFCFHSLRSNPNFLT